MGFVAVPVFLLAGCGEDSVELPEVPDVELPSPDVLNEQLLEGADGVAKILEQEYQLTDVGEVDCPAELALEVDCTVTVAGQEKTVTVSVLNENGEFEVSPPE
ncbi:DUF4333 domain-containing protein [Actinophytocola sp.]|uniref:DUF4333 domain-containing protein n=1 Tax=Actinophytocola sp. TaxID=1872138 RepID=UPI003D6C1CCA